MTKLDQNNVPCTWCIRAVPIFVFSRGDNFCTSKGRKITCTAYAMVNKITQPYYVFIQRLLSRTLRLDECAAQKAGFSCFQTVTDSLLKRLGYPEHCVYSERVCYRLYRPIKLYVFSRNCIGPRYFRQNLYIKRSIFGHKCIFKAKGLSILSAHRTRIFT